MKTKERNTNLQELFFAVMEQDIFTKADNSDKFIRIPGKKALINANNNQPISVVSNDYEIVKNEEAYNYGDECLRLLFKLGKEDKVELFNIVRPDTLSYCHMDLICTDKKFKHKKDEYMPFVRVTNSYNKLYKLYFRLGVCRWICANGMIFNEDSIKFSINHVKGSRDKIDFQILEKGLEEILKKFKSSLDILMDAEFDFNYTFPMLYKYLRISPDYEPKNEKQHRYIENLNACISRLSAEYKEELGDTFYTLYNIITDISTTGIEDEQLLVSKIHNRQSRASVWLDEVSKLLKSDKFSYEKYLEDYLERSRN